jgi:hypothetical protein
MGDFGCLIWPTSPDVSLDEEEVPAAPRLFLVALLCVLEVFAREPVAVFLLLLVTIRRGYFLPRKLGTPFPASSIPIGVTNEAPCCKCCADKAGPCANTKHNWVVGAGRA